jgi:hypothetical protein
MKMTSGIWCGLLGLIFFMAPPQLRAESSLVELLITRAPEKGLVSTDELKTLGYNEVLTQRLCNRVKDFDETHPKAFAVQREEFHRDLYEFIMKEQGQAFDALSFDLAASVGHDSNISLLPGGDEWAPSNQSSPYFELGLGLDWKGRQTPWGRWSLGFDFKGRDYNRKSLAAYDSRLVGAEIQVDYKSGWHWSLAHDWWLYGSKGSGHAGDIRSKILLGYQGNGTMWWKVPMVWGVDSILQRDDFRHAASLVGEDRYRYGVQGMCTWQSECAFGHWTSSFRHAWLRSEGSVDTLDYNALQTEFKTKVDLEKSVFDLAFRVNQEKRLDYRRGGSKSNDSFWEYNVRLGRPLWSESSIGYASVGARDLEARLEAVTFHSEEVILGMEWAW